MFVLSIVLPPKEGAAFGKATVFEPLPERKNLHTLAYQAFRKHNPSMPLDEASRFAEQIIGKELGEESVESSTGITFRIDPADNPPNVCPCCGRLVKPGVHAFVGDPDAYCDGCYTWGATDRIGCDPNHSAHPKPWTDDATDARYVMHVIIDHDAETGEDTRYSKVVDPVDMWDDEDNALIAWPGLRPEQFISIEIKEI